MTPLLLATTDITIPAPAAMTMVIIVIGGLVWLIQSQNTLKAYIRDAAGIQETSSTEIANQPVRVRKDADYVDSEDFDAHVKEHKRDLENVFSKIGGSERGTNSRLIEIDRKVAALDERTQTTNSSLTLLGQKVDTLIFELRKANK